MADYEKELKFLELCHKLKLVLRHCWFDGGRRESVADHSWRLSMMAYKFADKLD